MRRGEETGEEGGARAWTRGGEGVPGAVSLRGANRGSPCRRKLCHTSTLLAGSTVLGHSIGRFSRQCKIKNNGHIFNPENFDGVREGLFLHLRRVC